MTTTDDSAARYVLRKILAQETPEFVGMHRWFWERDRWTELVFALFSRVSPLSETHVRTVVDKLSALDLLDVTPLANLQIEDANTSTRGVRILNMLTENGFTSEEGQRCLTTICEAAAVVQNQYGGKIQKYLRHYGELMLEDLHATFHFTELNEGDVKYAFAYWLQNILEIPISLFDLSLYAFCEENGITPAELVEAADELDVNLAFVDDLVHQNIMRRVAKAEPPLAAAASNVQDK